jgi:lauroyl/myristoyl acyltransferase
MPESEPSDIYFRTEITGRVTPEDGFEEVVFYARRSLVGTKSRLFRESDIRTAAVLAVMLTLVVFVPCRYWARCAHVFAGFTLGKRLRKKWASFSQCFLSVLGEKTDTALKALFRETQNADYRRLFLLCAELASRKWQPRIEIEGTEGLRRALEAGNGAVVWCNQFTSQNIVGKRALKEAGFECYQVSVAEHGFSDSAFAKRFINPLTVHAENRYLKERVEFQRADAFQVTKRISQILKQNGVVLMTNNIYAGTSFAEMPLGDSGFLQVATTPASFAVRGGAALFAMSTIEIAPFECYRAVISPQIKFGTGAKKKSATSLAKALLQMRNQLLRQLQTAPEQYMLWARQATSTLDQSMEGGAVKTGKIGTRKL